MVATDSILIADPDAELLERCGSELRAGGLNVDVVSTVEDARGAYGDHHYGLVILESGFAKSGLVETIRGEDVEQDLLILLSSQEERDSAWSVLWGALYYLVKPFEVEELALYIDRFDERRMLVESQGRLLSESMEFEGLQRCYRVGMELLSRSDRGDLPGALLQAVAEAASGRAAALWLLEEEPGVLRFRCGTGDIAAHSPPSSLGLKELERAGLLSGPDPTLGELERWAVDPTAVEAPCLFVSLRTEDRVLGLIQCFEAEVGEFCQRDLNQVGVIAEFGGLALARGLTLSSEGEGERAGGLEIEERFLLERERLGLSGRSVGVVEFRLDPLSNDHRELAEFKGELEAVVSGALRGFDALAWREGRSLLCLLPERGLHRSMEFGVQVARELVEAMEQRGASQGIEGFGVGVGAYPGCGDSLEGVLVAARGRMEDSRRIFESGLFTREETVGGAIEAVLTRVRFEESSPVGEGGGVRGDFFSTARIEVIREEFLKEARRQRGEEGVFFVSSSGAPGETRILEELAGGTLTTFLLGAGASHSLLEQGGVVELLGEGLGAGGHEVVVLETTQSSYGFWGSLGEDGRYRGFQTTSLPLVAVMVAELRRILKVQLESV